jgi:hypothetical protein
MHTRNTEEKIAMNEEELIKVIVDKVCDIHRSIGPAMPERRT